GRSLPPLVGSGTDCAAAPRPLAATKRGGFTAIARRGPANVRRPVRASGDSAAAPVVAARSMAPGRTTYGAGPRGSSFATASVANASDSALASADTPPAA